MAIASFSACLCPTAALVAATPQPRFTADETLTATACHAVNTASDPTDEPPAAPFAGSTPTSAVSAAEAKAAFDRFATLAGAWHGQSTQGWADAGAFETIARGSVVMQTTEFEAHAGETMVTMYHLDRDRLILTHYCVAKNQPRLLLSSVADEGRTLTFTYLDGTNLASRDHGHMDKVIYRFDANDPNRFTSQWTWYQDGTESWMEEIAMERKP